MAVAPVVQNDDTRYNMYINILVRVQRTLLYLEQVI